MQPSPSSSPSVSAARDAARDAARELKIVFTGPMGAGKTTAIHAISDVQGLSTEVPMSEGAIGDKTMTTVGLDYGECQLEGGQVLKLFGTPGQERFRFMWRILGMGALGLIILIDNRSEDPIEEALMYIQAFSEQVPTKRMILGVGRMAEKASPSVEDYCTRLAAQGLQMPVLEVDVRRPEEVRLLLSVLVSLVEVEYA